MNPPLLYVLHSGQTFGTERMAIATLLGLAATDEDLLLAPPGPVHALAAAHGLRSQAFSSPAQLARLMLPRFIRHRRLGFIGTGVAHSLLACSLAALCRTQMRHLHVVHGGTDERLSYSRKRLLRTTGASLVAVSEFVRSRLIAHACDPRRILVIENFIPPSTAAPRADYSSDGVRRIAVISRLDRIKRVDLVLTALRRFPALAQLQISLYGSGEEMASLSRAAAAFPNLRLHGFVPDAAQRIRDADLLLHTCAEEPFGLALLEAFAARVAVLAPNAGGAGALIDDGLSGFHFAANDGVALGARLLELMHTPAATLNAVVARAQASLDARFAPEHQVALYRQLLEVPS